MGLDRLALLHLNDCQSAPGGHRDRHEHIGTGTIGDAGLRALLRRRELRDRAAILETPIREKEDDRGTSRTSGSCSGGGRRTYHKGAKAQMRGYGGDRPIAVPAVSFAPHRCSVPLSRN